MTERSTPRGAFWMATALTVVALPSWAAAQEEACVAIKACVDACEGFDDVDCVDACLASSPEDPEAVRLFEEAFACIRDSECAMEDLECLGDACGERFFELDDYCGFEDEDGRCDAIGECSDACEDAADGLACINLCIEQEEDEEVAGVYSDLIACLLQSGCPEGDEACFAEACGETFLEVEALCGGGEREDDFGNEPVDDCATSPGPDCCLLANDGECDSPDFCDEGTDTTDCAAIAEPEASPEASPEGPPAQEAADDEGSEGCATAPGAPMGAGWLLAALGIAWARRSSRRRGRRGL